MADSRLQPPDITAAIQVRDRMRLVGDTVYENYYPELPGKKSVCQRLVWLCDSSLRVVLDVVSKSLTPIKETFIDPKIMFLSIGMIGVSFYFREPLIHSIAELRWKTIAFITPLSLSLVRVGGGSLKNVFDVVSKLSNEELEQIQQWVASFYHLFQGLMRKDGKYLRLVALKIANEELVEFQIYVGKRLKIVARKFEESFNTANDELTEENNIEIGSSVDNLSTN